MDSSRLLLVAACAAITGCAYRAPATVNHGHPALNAISAPAPVAVAVPVQQYVLVPVQAAPAPVAPIQQLHNDPGRVAMGALIGGLAASHIGRGDGRVAAVAVGAGVGAMAAQGGYSSEAAVGGLAGALIGSHVGRGNGRVGAAALGAGLGTWLAVPRE
jgi:hypothetical protein